MKRISAGAVLEFILLMATRQLTIWGIILCEGYRINSVMGATFIGISRPIAAGP